MEYIIVLVILGVVYLAYRLDEAAIKRRDSGERWR
jgi:hypothetical protein